MNNEIGRKITSLTLMTIMLAGGLTFAAPSMMPVAHAANANLFVSAENSQFDNYMSGPQVIEVVIIDSDVNDTDEAKGEPDVTINGKKLRMAQAVDGNWYGYFADKTMAMIADYTSSTQVRGNGLDFGTFCTASSALTYLGVSVSDTSGVAVPHYNATGGLGAAVFGQNGTATGTETITGSCSTPNTTGTGNANGTNAMEVLREVKSLNIPASGSAINIGQIGVNGSRGVSTSTAAFWPFIQLYPLTVSGNVVIQYNKGGGTQTTTLTFDTVEQFAGSSLDRSLYPLSSQVHLTVTDLWLNIDPTDEDSWTFGTQSSNSTSFGAYYQVFDENGLANGDTVTNGAILLTPSVLQTMMIETNGLLRVNTDTQGTGTPVLTLQDNGDSNLSCTTANSATTCLTTGANSASGNELDKGSVPITITEQGPNSGVFGTYDETDTSVIKITTNAARGTSATLDYNEEPVSVVVGFGTATVDIAPTDAEWSSGEEIPITIVDNDANKNSRADEDLDLNNPDVSLIPSLKTGDPFTLGDDYNSESNVMYTSTTGLSGSGQSAITGSSDGVFSITGGNRTATDWSVDLFSQRGIFTNATAQSSTTYNTIVIHNVTTWADLKTSIGDTRSTAVNRLHGFNFLNIDVSNVFSGNVDVYMFNSSATQSRSIQKINTNSPAAAPSTVAILLANDVNAKSFTNLNGTSGLLESKIWAATGATQPQSATGLVSFLIVTNSTFTEDTANDPIVLDLFSFGFYDDGSESTERVANQIIRLELEETGDNTSTFAGTLEYIMINQLNILTAATYSALSTINDEATFVVIEDLTDEDAPRVNYYDKGADGVSTQVADQEAAPSHSGIVSFNSASYKTADTVIVTLEDLDLNVDSDLIEIYTTVTGTTDSAYDTVGKISLPVYGFNWGELGVLLDITFDDQRWKTSTTTACVTALTNAGITDNGLGETGFTLVETGPETGIFVGDFQIPSKWCRTGESTPETTNGLDIEVNYQDFRDASGEIIEVGDSAGVRANTGSVSLDRTVYPVPFGNPTTDFSGDNTESTPSARSVFPIHQTGMDDTAALASGEFIPNGDLKIHVRVNDPDFDISASGEDTLGQNTTSSAPNPFVGPVKVSVIRGSSEVVLGYAGGPDVLDGFIDIDDNQRNSTRQFGPMTEIAPDAGIFEADITVRYSDGPSSSTCPVTTISNYPAIGNVNRFGSQLSGSTATQCILQGDILQVEYTDPADASGDINTVTDSATFDLRNGVLQSDKSVYIIGSDMILTLIEPDFDLDNDQAETYDLDLIEWDSDAATCTMGDEKTNGGCESTDSFDPEPSNFRETGDSTGIFQIVVEIPSELGDDKLERGEEIVLEYSDWGPSGSDYVGDEDEDVNLTIYTSNFGATVELDQKVYTWTDKVYITIVAPDHNMDSNLVDEIGNEDEDPIKVSTRGANLDSYKLVETGTDTGIFTGEVILTGFNHDADGSTATGTATNGYDVTDRDEVTGGPTNGLLSADDDDGITVSFEFSEDETIVGSALIRWNIGEVQWLEASYPASGTGVVRVIDPDMNWNPEAVDNFSVDVWSDSDAGGIDLTVTETNEATGIFEGTVFFTVIDESSGHRLRVAEGDTVTAEYEDNTLPNPYTTADELDISATSLIGTVVPPLERAPAANLRTVDAFGNSLSTVSVDQQVQITADLANGQDREQAFAYLVQIQDGNGVTVSLAWITGSLSAGQSFSPALSWIPTDAGTYTATAFVWESVDNPTALSPPVSTTITVQ